MTSLKDVLQRVKDFDFKKLQSLNFYRRRKKSILKTALVFLLVSFLFHLIFLSPPKDFPSHQTIHVEKGASLEEIALFLENRNVIRYPLIFKTLAFISGNQKDLIAGDYYLNRRLSLFSILWRLAQGHHGLSPTAVTFPEGVTVSEIGQILKSEFEDFDEEEFLNLAAEKEGFLFPDTYDLLPNTSAKDVISLMERIFKEKTEELRLQIEASGYSLREIITMASLLEEEARTQETREMISGILWKRIEIDMALQVDAVFPYIIGKNTFELTLEDLEFDSPYNTYKYRGLPPGPISNPGLSSIRAALNPTESDFLFYLSDKHGMMHYAEDFEAHKRNKRIYLN